MANADVEKEVTTQMNPAIAKFTQGEVMEAMSEWAVRDVCQKAPP